MVVDLYSMTHGYGFCTSPEMGRVFFRVEDFQRLDPTGPLPISGEKVRVPEILPMEPSPRASSVVRVGKPMLLQRENEPIGVSDTYLTPI